MASARTARTPPDPGSHAEIHPSRDPVADANLFGRPTTRPAPTLAVAAALLRRRAVPRSVLQALANARAVDHELTGFERVATEAEAELAQLDARLHALAPGIELGTTAEELRSAAEHALSAANALAAARAPAAVGRSSPPVEQRRATDPGRPPPHGRIAAWLLVPEVVIGLASATSLVPPVGGWFVFSLLPLVQIDLLLRRRDLRARVGGGPAERPATAPEPSAAGPAGAEAVLRDAMSRWSALAGHSAHPRDAERLAFLLAHRAVAVRACDRADEAAAGARVRWDDVVGALGAPFPAQPRSQFLRRLDVEIAGTDDGEVLRALALLRDGNGDGDGDGECEIVVADVASTAADRTALLRAAVETQTRGLLHVFARDPGPWTAAADEVGADLHVVPAMEPRDPQRRSRQP